MAAGSGTGDCSLLDSCARRLYISRAYSQSRAWPAAVKAVSRSRRGEFGRQGLGIPESHARLDHHTALMIGEGEHRVDDDLSVPCRQSCPRRHVLEPPHTTNLTRGRCGPLTGCEPSPRPDTHGALRCHGCSTVGTFAYRFISRTSCCPHPGASCTVSHGELIGVAFPRLVTLIS